MKYMHLLGTQKTYWIVLVAVLYCILQSIIIIINNNKFIYPDKRPVSQTTKVVRMVLIGDQHIRKIIIIKNIYMKNSGKKIVR